MSADLEQAGSLLDARIACAICCHRQLAGDRGDVEKYRCFLKVNASLQDRSRELPSAALHARMTHIGVHATHQVATAHARATVKYAVPGQLRRCKGDCQGVKITCSDFLVGRKASYHRNDTCTWPASLEMGNLVSIELRAR